MSREKAVIDVLIRFSQMLSRVAGPGEVLPLLAQASVEHLGAVAAAVLEVTPSGSAKVTASVNLPEAIANLSIEPDASGAEIAAAVLAGAGSPVFVGGPRGVPQTPPGFARAHAIPLVSGGDLFGTLVLLFEGEAELDARRAALAQGLVDLAATGLGRIAEVAELQRSHAELRASREVLKRGHKLRALGQMAAGVSHDLRNILNPLSLHLQFLKRALPKGDAEALESVAEMQQVLKRGLETLERLRDFSRQSPSSRVDPVDLDRAVREAVEICRPRQRSQSPDVHIKVVEELGGPRPVAMRASEAVSALVNLIVNAVDAMTQGGRITIATGESDGGGWVRVADDGPGMPPEIEQRVFEPFFTTKGDEGTGLGLAMVYAAVQRHGGRVTLETAPGKGAAFTIWIPLA